MGKLSQREFAAAVDQHYRIVYQLSAGLLSDPAEAQDVTQETFTQYWQHGAKAQHPKAWLIRVARNRCFDRLRRRTRLEYREPESLPEPQRSIVVLFSLKGMSGKKYAEALGLTVNQVKVYLHRARSRLRDHIDRQELAETEISHG